MYMGVIFGEPLFKQVKSLCGVEGACAAIGPGYRRILLGNRFGTGPGVRAANA